LGEILDPRVNQNTQRSNTQRSSSGDDEEELVSSVVSVRDEVFPRDSHPVLVYLASLSPGSRRTMRSSLDMVAGFLSGGASDSLSIDWSMVRYQHMSAIRAAISEVYAPSTANKILSAAKGVMKECSRLGYLSAEDLARACDVPSVKGHRASKGRALSRDELESVFHVCSVDKNRTRGVRDYAILAIMYSSGLRRSEVVNLDVQDYDPRSCTLRVRSGKGNQDRTSPINLGSCEATDRWLSIIVHDTGPLFRPISKSGNVLEKGMTDQGVLYVLQRRARESGVEAFTPHDLRRTFIGDLLDAGADISTVQQLAGHANVQTTARYDRRGEEAKRRAATMLDLP
jgi:site-specific recombinase XerD